MSSFDAILRLMTLPNEFAISFVKIVSFKAKRSDTKWWMVIIRFIKQPLLVAIEEKSFMMMRTVEAKAIFHGVCGNRHSAMTRRSRRGWSNAGTVDMRAACRSIQIALTLRSFFLLLFRNLFLAHQRNFPSRGQCCRWRNGETCNWKAVELWLKENLPAFPFVTKKLPIALSRIN